VGGNATNRHGPCAAETTCIPGSELSAAEKSRIVEGMQAVRR
jgi:hypothetical protein